MEQEVQFVYGTWELFQRIQNKDPGTLYFLDNNLVYKGNLLLTSVLSVSTVTEYTDEYGFPLVDSENHVDKQYRNRFLISLINGEIRFVNNDLTYTSVTELALGSILVNLNFLQLLIAAIADTQEVRMPTLTVNGDMLVWAGSNVDSITVFIPKQ